jgi:hypothetical protein
VVLSKLIVDGARAMPRPGFAARLTSHMQVPLKPRETIFARVRKALRRSISRPLRVATAVEKIDEDGPRSATP